MWTRFMDMHSGGGKKEDVEYIYIEAPEKEAKVIFYNRFGHSADRVTCSCCGADYSTDTEETLDQATGYDRNCEWDKEEGKYVEIVRSKTYGQDLKLIPLEEYVKSPGVMVIYEKDIKPEEREGEAPKQGYVWVD